MEQSPEEGDDSSLICSRPECVRTRRRLTNRPRPEVIYRSIETVRVWRAPWWWLLSVMIALAWSVACVQKSVEQGLWPLILGLANFVGAFLPLWRQLYVDTPLTWFIMAWIIMATTFYTL